MERVTWLPFPRPPQLLRDITDPREWKARFLVRGDNLCEHNWVGLKGNKTCFVAFPSFMPSEKSLFQGLAQFNNAKVIQLCLF